MSYQKKYYYEFMSLDNKLNLVEIWQDTTDTITAAEIKGTTPPFTVSMPKIDNVFQPVRGTGCVLNLLSQTDSEFWDSLYHVDPTEFLVKHYIDGTINWLGYLNSELFRESYSFTTNYKVTMSGNDGFALMDRFNFVQSDGSDYTGLMSIWDIILTILGKIGLPWANIQVFLSTVVSDLYLNVITLGAEETLFHRHYLDCANFYDEDDAPMTLRDVMNTVLEPFGAVLFPMFNGDLVIADVNLLATGNLSGGLKYTLPDGTYSDTAATTNVFDVYSIGYMGTGQSKEISGGVNKQVVAYSPYSLKGIIPGKTISIESEFEIVPDTWSTKNGYYYKILGINETWQENTVADFEESYYESDPQLYLRWTPNSTNWEAMSLKVLPHVSFVENSVVLVDPVSDAVAIKIELEVLTVTKANPYDTNTSGKDYQSVEISRKIKIGDKYYGGIHGWTTTDYGTGTLSVDNPSGSVSNKFVKSTTIIPIQSVDSAHVMSILSGGFDFELWSDIFAFEDINSSQFVKNPVEVLEVWLKNIQFTIVKGDGTEIADTDIEYIGMLDETFKNEGKKVTLKAGTNVHGTDKAKILGVDDNGKLITIDQFKRNTKNNKIEELLLISLVSNYKAGSIKLVNMHLKNGFHVMNLITDSLYLSGHNFMVGSANIDYWNNKIDCDLIEIFPDSLTIVV